MESASDGAGEGDEIRIELARVREALDDLRRRPVPLDMDALRHVVTASLAEASAPPPNLLVTAIRRLDRLDARLESIEAALGGPGALPRGGPAPVVASGGRATAMALPAAGSDLASPLDPEAVADALARRLASTFAAQATALPRGGGASVDDLVAALRPLVRDASRSVLRRSGHEPSAQAVEVLQQAALAALEEAASSLGPVDSAAGPFAPPADRRPSSPPALAAPVTPPPPPVDHEALASTIAARVAEALVAEIHSLSAQAAVDSRDDHEPPAAAPSDPAVVADAVISRLTQQPPPQAVLSPVAMAPLLSAVGNVEAAVARLAEPEEGVAVAVDRLEAGVGALARALEEDRTSQAEAVQRGFSQVNELVRAELAALAGSAWPDEGQVWASVGDDQPEIPEGDGPGSEPEAGPLAGVQRGLDRLTRQLAPLTRADLAAAVPGLAAQAERLERSLGQILGALAGLAEHMQRQSAAAPAAGNAGPDLPAEVERLHGGLADVATRISDLVASTAAERQRFQRLGGTIDGLAELIGQVSERLDHLPRPLVAGGVAPPGDAGPAAAPAPAEHGVAERPWGEAGPWSANDPGALGGHSPAVTDPEVDEPSVGSDDPEAPVSGGGDARGDEDDHGPLSSGGREPPALLEVADAASAADDARHGPDVAGGPGPPHDSSTEAVDHSRRRRRPWQQGHRRD